MDLTLICGETLEFVIITKLVEDDDDVTVEGVHLVLVWNNQRRIHNVGVTKNDFLIAVVTDSEGHISHFSVVHGRIPLLTTINKSEKKIRRLE